MREIGVGLWLFFLWIPVCSSAQNESKLIKISEYEFGYKVYVVNEQNEYLDSVVVMQANPKHRIKPVIKGDQLLFIGMRIVPDNFFYDFRSYKITPGGFESVDRCSAHISAWAHENQIVDRVKMNKRKLRVRFFDESTKEYIKADFDLHEGTFAEFCGFIDNMH